MSRKVLAILSQICSLAVLFWMAVAWVLLYVTLAIWGKEAFGNYIIRLSTDILLQVPFAVFIAIFAVNFIAYAIRCFGASWRSAVLWVTFPLGLLLFLTGFFLSASFTQTGRAIVGLGDPVNPPFADGSYVVGDIRSGISDEFIDIETDDSPLFSYEPLVFLDSGRIRHEVGVFPPTRIGNAYFHIMDFGIAPGVRISRDGMVVNEGYVIQKLFPPGNRDSFELSPLPYRFALRLMPARRVLKGTLGADIYDIAAPRYDIVIQKGEDVIFKGDSTQDIIFDEYRLDFIPPTYWVWMEASNNPGLIILAAGLTLTIIGIPMIAFAMLGRMYYSRIIDNDKG